MEESAYETDLPDPPSMCTLNALITEYVKQTCTTCKIIVDSLQVLSCLESSSNGSQTK